MSQFKHISEMMKRAQRGLFAGKRIQTGHYIGFSNKRTNRKWMPNIQRKNLHSLLLKKTYTLNVSTTALRCIDKAGGFDNYMLFTKPKDLDSERGRDIQKNVIKAWEKKHSKEEDGVVVKKKFSRSRELFKDKMMGGALTRMMYTYQQKRDMEEGTFKPITLAGLMEQRLWESEEANRKEVEASSEGSLQESEEAALKGEEENKLDKLD